MTNKQFPRTLISGVPIFFLWPILAANPRPAGLKRALSKLAFPQPGGTDFGGRALRADPYGTTKPYDENEHGFLFAVPSSLWLDMWAW